MSKTRILGINLSILPAIGVALLPKLFCPACWPAYAGLLSSLGLGFFDYTPYMLPAMLVFVVIALFFLWYRAPQRRGYGPLLLGLLAATILLGSKFYMDSEWLMWSGLVLLVSASVWNSWPRRTQPACPSCIASS